MGKYRDKITNVTVFGFMTFIAFIFMFESPLNIFESSGTCGIDSSVFKTVGFYMQNGYMPYRDIFDHKGPLIYIYNYLGNMISYWRGIWLIELLSLCITFCFLFRIAHIFCGKILSVSIVVAVASSLFGYFKHGNYTEEYALPFITISLYIFLEYFVSEKISKTRLIICGLSFGAVCMLRINMIPTWLVFCTVVLVEVIKNKKYEELRGFIGYFIIGVVCIILPIIAWLIKKHAFVDFINDYFLFNMKYTSVNGVEKFFSFMSFFNNKWVLFTMLITMYLLYKKRNILYISYLFYYLLTLIMISMSGREYAHYGMIMVPMFVFPIAAVISFLGKYQRGGVSAIIGIYILSISIMPIWLEKIENVMLLFKNRAEEQMDVTQEVASYIVSNTSESDLITVWGNWNIIYARSQRFSASKYSYQSTIGVDSNRMEEYFEEIEKNLPRYIVIQPEMEMGEMEQFIQEHDYDLVREIEGALIYEL